MRVIIYPYKMSSKSAKQLQKGFQEAGVQCLRVYPDGKYRPRSDDLIINWGSSREPTWATDNMLNGTQRVGHTSNKLKAFELLKSHNINIPWYTTDKAVAINRMLANDSKMFCRTILTGHSGRGIVVASTPEEVIDAPLYTESFPKTNEYRVHVMGESCIDLQEKRKRSGTGRERGDVWNHSNNFVFCRSDTFPPLAVCNTAISATKALGLKHCALDIGYDERTATHVVFEANTAPGIEGSTVNHYVSAFLGSGERTWQTF